MEKGRERKTHPSIGANKHVYNAIHIHSFLQLFSEELFIMWASLGGLDGKKSGCNAGDLGLIPGSERPPEEGNGNPLQYSCLEKSMDGGAWQAPGSPWGCKELNLTEWLTVTYNILWEGLHYGKTCGYKEKKWSMLYWVYIHWLIHSKSHIYESLHALKITLPVEFIVWEDKTNTMIKKMTVRAEESNKAISLQGNI